MDNLNEKVKIIGAESFGVRSMCCFVKGDSKGYLIDPGVSLAPKRFGLPPHRLEIEEADRISRKIEEASKDCENIIITHYHHDHFTPWYEHEYNTTGRFIYDGKKIFVKSWLENINQRQKVRANDFIRGLEERKQRKNVEIADGKGFGDMVFSPAFHHGEKERGVFVIMVSIKTQWGTFVHGSDIQCFDEDAVKWIIGMKPSVLFLSGPPIYLPQIKLDSIERARKNILDLLECVPHIIIDHHLARTEKCFEFIQNIQVEYEAGKSEGVKNHKIYFACEWMGEKALLLEARRKDLFRNSQ